MKTGRLILTCAALAALLEMASNAHAQTATAVSSCGGATYSAGQNYPLQQTTTGNACTNATLTGSVTVGNATITAPLGVQTQAASVATTVNGALPAGTNVLGKVGIDQTTPGTTNGVQVNAALPAGTNVIGKTGIDQTTPGTTNGVQTLSGSTTAVTQPTAASLNATVVGAGTAGTPSGGVVSVQGVSSGTSLPVSQATAASLNATVVGTGTFATQATLQAGSAIAGKFGVDQTTPGTTNGVAIAPSSASGVGITSVVSASAENNHVLKASAGNLYGAYATNLTSTAGFLEIFNATSAPSDGAVTPIACVALPPTGTASLSRSPGPPQVYSTGITAVVSSASSCFTKTTGTITAFISGDVQ